MSTAKIRSSHRKRAIEKAGSLVHCYVLVHNRESPICWQVLPIKGTKKVVGVLHASFRCCGISMFWESRRLQFPLDRWIA